MLTRPLRERLAWGASWGLGYGLVLSVWAALLYGAFGAAPFRARHLTFPDTVALYVVGGAAGGLLLGLLLPIARAALGAFVTGTLVIVPIGALTLTVVHQRYSLSVAILSVALGSVAMGGPLGLIYRRRFWYQIVAERRHLHRYTTRRAARAFRKNEYQEVLALLEPIATQLRGGDLRRLEQARQRRERPAGHAP